MENKGDISLLGCGWLGLPLAKSLIFSGFTVKATTTSESKLEVFRDEGIDPYLVQFSVAGQIPDLGKFFDTETLIITIPPGRKDPNGFENYQQMIQFVCKQLPSSNISRVILISSTSVYADNNDEVDERVKVQPESDSGILMVDTELLLANQHVNLISLRLAGLIGPDRMPGRFFAGKSNIPNGLAPINLIHLNDAVGIINTLIKNKLASGIYNACAPLHPTKAEFYTLAAEVEGLPRPGFILEKNKWKIITCPRIEKELGYQFEIPSSMEWLVSL
ncbi:SDR family oxidoreductase [Daejeonella lutea]|uniref:Nucleoside-diphosphate-sugar epimerase n=1 Tax=Daejeonella lutea TaxID=572036 RepID=A0A1T5DT39_9SPHI|nr:SDR family oxidoreductase [Daejeonella lutea]SKB74947.1 Nucleoside-diphosphate-sugar epimerase [Daejeonella lutea]